MGRRSCDGREWALATKPAEPATSQQVSRTGFRRGSMAPAIAPAWRRAWEHAVPMFAFPPAVRKVYSTISLGSLRRSLRKIIKTRSSFPSDEAVAKLLFLAIRNAGMRWRRPVNWTTVMGQFAFLFEDRFPASLSLSAAFLVPSRLPRANRETRGLERRHVSRANIQRMQG